MLNLLRRSKNRKSYKNRNFDIASDEDEGAAIMAMPTASSASSGIQLRGESERPIERKLAKYDKAPPLNWRVAIDDLEDFFDLKEMSADETGGRDFEIYFERIRDVDKDAAQANSDAHRHDAEYEKVKLAKTAADTHAHSYAVAITRNENTTKNNSADQTQMKTKYSTTEAESSESNVDNINKTLMTTQRGYGGRAGSSDHEATLAVISTNTSRSQIETTKWQGHARAFSEESLIGKIINDYDGDVDEISPEQSHISRDQDRKAINCISIAPISVGKKNAERSNALAPHSRTEFDNCNSPSVATSVRATSATDTVNNEVKYRNIDANTHKPKTQHCKTKRQSRLSLTNFGLSLSGRGKTNTSNNHNTNTETPTSKQTVTEQSAPPKKKSQKSLSTPSSFFGIISKSSPEKPTASTSENSKLLKPLQKSREFLSDIFMARGRNHNRNRNNHHTRQPQHLLSHQSNYQQQLKGDNKSPGPHIANKDVISAENNYTPLSNATVIAHLEKSSDPACASTNSYQMTMSNNSRKNLYSETIAKEESLGEAELVNHEHNSAAESAQRSSCEIMREKGERINEDSAITTTDTAELNQARSIDCAFIHAAVVQQRGVQSTEDLQVIKDENIAKVAEAAAVEARIPGTNDLHDVRQLRDNSAECDRDRLGQQPSVNVSSDKNSSDSSNVVSDITAMGQTSGKPEQSTTPSSRASTPRDFRESVISDSVPVPPPRNLAAVPTITVVDCSDKTSRSSLGHSLMEQEDFFDFEADQQIRTGGDSCGDYSTINITPADEDYDASGELSNEDVQIPVPIYQQKWTRLSHAKLENVPEQEEEEDEDAEEMNSASENDVDLDNVFTLYGPQQSKLAPRKVKQNSEELQHSSPERSPLKSTNTSDSNLSTSFPDSGIGGDSQLSPRSSREKRSCGNDPASASASASVSAIRSTQQQYTSQRPPFVRDGNSTDCDDTLMQCDELDEERLVCIESISLPDVVVESTTASGEQVNINISGATSNSAGNVHFIPIHMEGSGSGGLGTRNNSHSRSNSPKGQSIDDSGIGCNGKNSKRYLHTNSQYLTMPPTIEIIEDTNVLTDPFGNVASKAKDLKNEQLKQELSEQKTHFSIKLEDAQKNVDNLENKVGEMQTKIEKLEQELALKTWNVERLQGELNAAQKDDEYVRKKLKILEDEKTSLRHKYSENEDEFRRKLEELESQYRELTGKYKESQSLLTNLQTQLAAAQLEAEEWRGEVDKIRADLEEQTRILKNALENSEAERKICEDKWQKEFEMLRTQNMDREETLMTDCEWQLRQMQKQSKEKIEKSEESRKIAQQKAEELECEIEKFKEEAENLRNYQAQVNSLRGIVSEQEHSIQVLMEQIENLKVELETANDNLETQMEAVRKIKYQCDNALYDKERQMIYRIDEVRNEAAAFWEDKLYTEMTRLKNELESVYVDERRDALDKLQIEHIEELRALTTRYTANEDELRAELEELQERLDKKNQEFLDLREKSDNALLQTRMHLDRADREYQTAMCREEERRELLEEKLRKEFEVEKENMEESFRERLEQAKEKFVKELEVSTHDMIGKHKKELDKQKAKLQAEKDEALQELGEKYRKKLAAVEEKSKDIEIRHQRDLKDLKAAYDAEKAALDKRDISNANEIEMLHRKCRCLTNLFEEMRMRYERRDPRPEDLREISELRTRCESQERDLYVLTDRLREMQIQMEELQHNGDNNCNSKRNGKSMKKPPPKTIPTRCDVIYEENEERDSPPPAVSPSITNANSHMIDDVSSDQTDSEEEIDEDQEQSDTESNHKMEINRKDTDRINEDDAHMVTAV